MNSLLQLVSDPYERKARLVPGLLAVLPAVLPFVLLLGVKNPLIAGALTVCSACGVMFLLARIARTLGKRKEEALVAKWGGLPTTILLRHRDAHFDSHSKMRYHQSIATVTGITMPTPDQEDADEKAADDAYRGAVTRLRELTRGPGFPLLMKENTSYGFHRNMQGLRPVGAAICIVVLFIVGVNAGVIALDPLAFHGGAVLQMSPMQALSALIAAGFLLCWTFFFTAGATRSAGNAYAERLFEASAQLATQPAARKSASKKKAPATAVASDVRT